MLNSFDFLFCFCCILANTNKQTRFCSARRTTVPNIFDFFSIFYTQDTPGFPKKMSVHSVQPFGRLWGTYIYVRMSCFNIWYIEDDVPNPLLMVQDTYSTYLLVCLGHNLLTFFINKSS